MMSISNWEERPRVTREKMTLFKARDRKTAQLYGSTVAAAEIANVDFKLRFAKYSHERKMSDPPSCGRIFMGYLVVRRLNTPEEYETWMPDHVFDELYEATESQSDEAK